MPEEEFVKIVIDLPDAEDGLGGEGVWSVCLGNDLYEVRNSPWHTTEINYLDVVRAVSPSPDKKPVVQEVARRGGHRTIHVVFLPEALEKSVDVLDHVHGLGGTYEGAHATLYAIDIEPETDFDLVIDYLKECQRNGWVDLRYASQPQPPGTQDTPNG